MTLCACHHDQLDVAVRARGMSHLLTGLTELNPIEVAEWMFERSAGAAIGSPILWDDKCPLCLLQSALQDDDLPARWIEGSVASIRKKMVQNGLQLQ